MTAAPSPEPHEMAGERDVLADRDPTIGMRIVRCPHCGEELSVWPAVRRMSWTRTMQKRGALPDLASIEARDREWGDATPSADAVIWTRQQLAEAYLMAGVDRHTLLRLLREDRPT